jgi:adenylate cyclase class IV
VSGDELELKAVVPDPAQLHSALRKAGATLEWTGVMADRRYDRAGQLAGRDEVLRVRRYQGSDGMIRSELAWKGPTERSPEGYKRRQEIELAVADGDPSALLRALGFVEVHAIDRRIEQYRLDGTMIRVERYPRMDVLVEVEGTPAGIERAIAASGIPRTAFLPDALTDFVGRYEAAGRQAAVSVAALKGAAPVWEDG